MPSAVYPLMLVVFGFTTGEFVIAGILPEVAGDLSVSIASAGLLVSAYALGMIVGGPVVTALTARQPRKRLIVGLILVSVTGNLLSAVAPAYPLLLAGRFVAGLVVATFFAVGITIATSTAAPNRRASAVARVTLGMNLGIVLGTPLGTFIGQAVDWRATFVALAAVSAAGLALVARFVPPIPGNATASVRSELRVLRGREVQIAIALTAAGNLGIVMVFTYITPLLTDVAGFAATSIPVLLLVYGAGAVLGNLAGGRLADRALLASLAALLGALAGVLGLFWLLGGSTAPAAVLTFALGALAFAIIPGMQTRVVTAASAAPTLAVAVNASGFQLAAALAGWLGGRIIAGPLALPSLPLVAALLTLAGLTIALYSLRRDRNRAPTGSPVGD